MKKFLFVAAAAAVMLSACNTSSKSIKTEDDSLAYCIGTDLGSYIKNLDSTINIDIVAQGIRDVIANKRQIEQEPAYAFLREYFTVRKPAKELAKSKEFMADVEKNTKGVQKTPDGILYVIENQGSAVKPMNDADQVRVMYKGTLPSGKVFDSSYDRKDTAQFALNQVIKGWAEGIKLVGEGGKIQLWIPSELAYGEQGAGSISPNQAIHFEVELVKVIPAPAVDSTKIEKPAAAPAPAAHKK